MNPYFSKNLRYFRICNHYTQEAMSHLLNLSRQAYNHYETGNRTPDLETFLSISKLLDVPMDYFFMESLPESYISRKKLTKLLKEFPQHSHTVHQFLYDTVHETHK